MAAAAFFFVLAVWCFSLRSASCRSEESELVETIPVVGKSTWSSSDYYGRYPGKLAVDGRLDTFFHSVDGDLHPWWVLDLGMEHCLGRVSVTLRHNCCRGKGRFTGALVRAGHSSSYAHNAACGLPATRDQALVTGSTIAFRCVPPRMARYVTVDIDPTNPGVEPIQMILTIAEVGVEAHAPGLCDNEVSTRPTPVPQSSKKNGLTCIRLE